MANPAGETNGEALRLDFDRRLILHFRGLVVTSDAGFARLSSQKKRLMLLQSKFISVLKQ